MTGTRLATGTTMTGMAISAFAALAAAVVVFAPAAAEVQDRSAPFDRILADRVDRDQRREERRREDGRASRGSAAEAGIARPSALAPAMRAGLTGREPFVSAFYAARGHAPMWVDGEGRATDAGRALVAALGDAGRHALPPARYDADRLAARLAAGGTAAPADAVALELALTEAFLRYGRDISSGLLEPGEIDRNLYVEPPRPAPRLLLERMARSADPAETLAGLAPDHPDYAVLVERLAAYRALARDGGWGGPVSSGPTLRANARSPQVPAIRARLEAMGDLGGLAHGRGTDEDTRVAANDVTYDSPVAVGTASPNLYDAQVMAAVKRFQERHGLNQDGVVGPATRAALNHDAEFRARQIAVNLERIRWLNKPLGRRHVMVNLPAFSVALVEDDREIFTSRVVIGKKKHPTPEFSDEMEHMVVNPTWYVPRSIATNEILPKLRRDPGYLQRKNMRITGVSNPWAVNWSQVTPGTFPGSVRQGPGPGNALGRVKFMFPNDHAIYLHDTPSRSLFNRDIRAYSHGCVRVHEPAEFARHLLAPQMSDPAGSFDAWVRRGRERYVHLDEHVPVHITYRTAWVDAAGRDQFRGDIYGRDAEVAAALERTGVELLAN